MEKETLPALIRRLLSQKRDAVLIERVAGVWTSTSSEQLLMRVENLACAIRDAGLKNGDRVALIAADCVNWVIVDFAILFAGCVVVPVFPTQADDQTAYILQNSEARLVFTDTIEAAQRLRNLSIPVPEVIVFESTGTDSLARFETRGAQVRAEHADWPQVFEAHLNPDELAVLMYTSGTTGQPKGVMLSHDNLGFTAKSAFSTAFGVLRPGNDVLSVLPFSHIYEHSVIYGYMLARSRHHICHHVDELLADLQSVRPVTMTSVPRIFERMLAGITAKAKSLGGMQAQLVPWALRVGRDYMTAKTMQSRPTISLTLQYHIAHAAVLKRLRTRLGLSRVKFLVSGSAPLHVDTAMTMLAMDVPIVEGYGPTECSPVVTVNTLQENHYGTVGPAIPGVQVALAADGEILVRGQNVMLGYYKDEAATSEAIQDGWYHTGDVGVLDDQGFLRITDRKRELFKTSGGKFIAPSRVEAAIKRSVYINQAMLVGDSRPYPAALVSPNWDLLKTEMRIDKSAPVHDLVHRNDVVRFIRQEVHEHTLDLAKFEQVRLVGILPAELSVEDGDLSPTLKVKRRTVEQKYKNLIEQLYARGDEHTCRS